MNWHFSLSAAIQIFVLYLIIYSILKYAKGTRFGQALTGVGVLSCALFGFSFVFHFEVLTKIFQFLLVYLAVSSVVIFQPEIRRLLPAIGSFTLFSKSDFDIAKLVTPERLTDCIMSLAQKRLGALIAIERGISLRAYMESGIPLGAAVTPELLQTIFTPPLPLHDGGIVIQNGRIAAAHCVFPVSNSQELIVSGMRHRAAVGLSEETDAVIIVVSEETGKVSIAYNGKIHRYPDDIARKMVRRWISLSSLNRIRDREVRVIETSVKTVKYIASMFASRRERNKSK